MRRVPHVIESDSKGERVYDLYSKLLQSRIVFLVGEINMELADDVVAQLLLLEATSDNSPIYMYINSPGGDISAMYGIYDTMKYVSCPVHTIGYGHVMSAASMLVAAGEPGHRCALPNTNFMIHNLASGSQGKYQDLKNYQTHIDKTHNQLLDYYVEFTGQNRKKLEQDLMVDYYLSADEAKNYGKKGLIDFIQLKSNRNKEIKA